MLSDRSSTCDEFTSYLTSTSVLRLHIHIAPEQQSFTTIVGFLCIGYFNCLMNAGAAEQGTQGLIPKFIERQGCVKEHSGWRTALHSDLNFNPRNESFFLRHHDNIIVVCQCNIGYRTVLCCVIQHLYISCIIADMYDDAVINQ